MAKRAGNNKHNYDETRAKFLLLAEAEFSSKGYARASTTSILTQSGMARGTLYYHFKDKQDLFCAVYLQTMCDIADDLRQLSNNENDDWQALLGVSRAYFDRCICPQRNRTFLMDAQTALSYETRQMIIAQTIRPVFSDVIGRVCKAGAFDGRNKDMLALFIFGTLSEAGRTLNAIPNKAMATTQFFDMFEWALKKMA